MNKSTRYTRHARQAAIAVAFVAAAISLTACGSFSVNDEPSTKCSALAGTKVPENVQRANEVCDGGNGLTTSDVATRTCPSGGSYFVFTTDELVYVGKPGATWAAFSGDKSKDAETAAVACK
jgi:hypothetical protein